MANKVIKGLTVEIGGDTTKLGKALQDVEKKSRDLSGELSDINKLLKLDPTNTDLLAQKQKVLAEAVSTTRDKLDTLKKAEKQVQEQFERGEASEEQVRALQREIIATSKKLNSYEKAAKETADAIEELGDASDDVQDGTKKTSKGADDASDALDDLADSADKAGDAGEGLGSKLGGVAKAGLAALTGAVTAAGAALVGSAEATREYRTAMGKLDTAFTTSGHSSAAATKTYQALQGVLGESDQAVEAANHLAKLTDNEQDLSTWTDIATGVFATFGDSLPIEGLTEAANETAKVGQVTGPLADALNWAGVSEDAFNESLAACSSEQERQALITETLNGLYSDAATAYKETNAEVIRANEANEAWTAAMAEAGAAVEPLLTDVKLLGASLLSDLMPGITGVTDAFRGVLNGDEGAASNLGAALSGLITDALTKATELLPEAAKVAVSLVGTLATSIITALPELVSTIAQVAITVVTGLSELVPQLASAIAAAIPELASTLSSALPELISGLVSLVSALAASIDQILPPLIGALPGLIMSICSAIVENLPILLDAIISLVSSLIGYIGPIVQAILPLIPQIISMLLASLADNLPTILDAIISLVILIVTQVLPTVIAEIFKCIPQIIGAIVVGLGQILASLVKWAGSLLGRIGSWLAGIGASIGEWFAGIWGEFTSWLTKTINKVTSWASDLAQKGKKAAKDLVTNVVDGIKSLPEKVKKVGKDLVEGLWNGIKSMADWVKDKIKGFTDGVLSGIKDFFGVHSPSKETEWIGNMLDRGLAEGVLANADAPLDAMAQMADDMLGEADSLNGLTLNRQLTHTFSQAETAAQSGLLNKLDNILAAVERGQVLLLDGDTLVGATVDRLDRTLGQRRLLTERGAM